MKRVKIRDIMVLYDESQESIINYVKIVISNNYDLILSAIGTCFFSFVPTSDKNAIYIEGLDDFNKCFSELVYNQYESFSVKELMNNPEFHASISDESFDSLMAYKYYETNGTFDDFVNYLKFRTEKEKIIYWLQNKMRFETYNFLLQLMVNYLKENDFTFFQSIYKVMSGALDEKLDGNGDKQDNNQISLPTLTLPKLDKLFCDFLQYINAPEEWKKTYDKLKNNNLIVIKNRAADDFDESECLMIDGELKILLSFDGTIASFCSFVHEFTHYITMKDKPDGIQLSVAEFPSIFFEKVSTKFLIDNGYSEEVVMALNNKRQNNNVSIYSDLGSLFGDITRFARTGSILRSDKVLFWENQFKSIRETKEKIVKLWEANGIPIDDDMADFMKMPSINIEEAIDSECDMSINNFIQKGLNIVDGYQYLLGTYLSNCALEKMEDNHSIINKIIYITNCLSELNLEGVLDILDMKDLFSNNDLENKSKKRKI